jgi:hypothetical protein
MSDVPAVDPTGPSGPAHQEPDNAKLEKAFGLYLFEIMQPATSDAVKAINDDS